MSSTRISITLTSPSSDLLKPVISVLERHSGSEYYVYERKDCWHIGLGSYRSLIIDSSGSNITISVAGEPSHHCPYTDTLGSNYAAHIRGLEYTPGKWPLLALMIPRMEVLIDPDNITITGDDTKEVLELCALLKETCRCRNAPLPGAHDIPHVDVNENSSQYKILVEKALSQIQQNHYSKIILSRPVNLQHRVDMPSTLHCGRQSNTPSRSFSLRHGNYQATGFSPELVMSLDKGVVTTEPLAGTRSCKGTEAEIQRLRHELENDSKEIVEHVISVKEAVHEISQLSDKPMVEDFMSVRVRGSVQHLGSRVCGRLSPDKDMWDAFNVLFPSITASGIPKKAAIDAISRLESQPRELYSGAILMIEDENTMEAALVLRSVFQDRDRQWIQAGAGVIAESDPSRELTETCEKLASIAPFVVREAKGLEDRINGYH
ncbi:salicylate synthetase [Aspergillus costaricaensis CBS 115574]|uniref:Salicylate synthetase n=1 Tax=Aspergillus costaricaensis CBS 115574 TaxID=1448317 RepID=A0ACD1IUS5_9EURO|nr:salicylate synthetase [Aspergillus costaricaensis CBS 115574]RAK93403.1 salicylate synthetase [Aspergillus costaricaensis CBS 115574]